MAEREMCSRSLCRSESCGRLAGTRRASETEALMKTKHAPLKLNIAGPVPMTCNSLAELFGGQFYRVVVASEESVRWGWICELWTSMIF